MNQNAPSNVKKISFSLDYRIIIVLLLVVIGVMLFLWKPWEQNTTVSRTIEVSGEATISAEPDEFVFTPSYQFKNSDRTAALKDLAAKSNELVAKIKALGVPNNKISTNSDSWSFPSYGDSSRTPTYTLRLTVTATSLQLAQKVEDYLVTTTPIGEVSPEADFSDSKRKTLQNQARDQATKDARAKAEQSARNLGFKIKSVKAVDDGNGNSWPFATSLTPYAKANTEGSSTDLTVQPGENKLTYTVTVVYFIK